MGERVRDGKLQERARVMRRAPTASERAVWRVLLCPPFDVLHFRRQVPFKPRFIADFASHRGRIIVEVDGPSHDLNVTEDAERTEWLNAQAYRVVRLSNHAVATAYDLALVIEALIGQ